MVEAYLPWQFEKLQDDVTADLIHFAFHVSTAKQNALPFYKAMFAAYAAGGWPCGWSDTYPAGQLIVFWPPTDSIPKVPTSIHERRIALKKQRLQERLKLDESTTEAEMNGLGA